MLGMQYWLYPVQQVLVCWKCPGNLVFGRVVLALSSPTRPDLLECSGNIMVCWACSIGSDQPNKTWSAGMLRQCGVLGMQYWLCPVQQVLVCWKCSGNYNVVFWTYSIGSVQTWSAGNVVCWACSIGSVQSYKTWSAGNPQAMWCFGHAVLALSSPTRPGLLEMLRQCGVLGMLYWLCPVQQVLVCWKCSGNVLCWTCSIVSIQLDFYLQAMWCGGHAVLIPVSTLLYDS